jgi:hypothetical protein
MRRGVVIRVVTVAFFGNGSLSSSSPQAEESPKSGTDLGVGTNEKRIPVNNRKTTRPIHRDFIAFNLLVICHVSDESVWIYAGTLDELDHGSSSFLNQ